MTRRHYDPSAAANAADFGLAPPVTSAVRPATETVDAHRHHVDGACPSCEAEHLASYRVLSEGGWWFVTKCQSCLTTTRRERAELLGPFVPLATRISSRKDA